MKTTKCTLGCSFCGASDLDPALVHSCDEYEEEWLRRREAEGLKPVDIEKLMSDGDWRTREEIAKKLGLFPRGDNFRAIFANWMRSEKSAGCPVERFEKSEGEFFYRARRNVPFLNEAGVPCVATSDVVQVRAKLFSDLLTAAQIYWKDTPGDFSCRVFDGQVTLGTRNRLSWSPHTGFVPVTIADESFAHRYETIGPLPAKKANAEEIIREGTVKHLSDFFTKNKAEGARLYVFFKTKFDPDSGWIEAKTFSEFYGWVNKGSFQIEMPGGAKVRGSEITVVAPDGSLSFFVKG